LGGDLAMKQITACDSAPTVPHDRSPVESATGEEGYATAGRPKVAEIPLWLPERRKALRREAYRLRTSTQAEKGTPAMKERRTTPKDKDSDPQRPAPVTGAAPADKGEQPAPAAAGLSEAEYDAAIGRVVEGVHG
jgi:hypothetical protein